MRPGLTCSFCHFLLTLSSVCMELPPFCTRFGSGCTSIGSFSPCDSCPCWLIAIFFSSLPLFLSFSSLFFLLSLPFLSLFFLFSSPPSPSFGGTLPPIFSIGDVTSSRPSRVLGYSYQSFEDQEGVTVPVVCVASEGALQAAVVTVVAS